jgi:hypothetical protein
MMKSDADDDEDGGWEVQVMVMMEGTRTWKRTVGRAGLALAIIAVVVARDERGIDVGLVGDCLAETVASERHCE